MVSWLLDNLKRLFQLLLVGGVLFLLVFGIVSPVTSRPSFCDNCHLIRPYIVSWRDHPHKGVNCLQCHTSRGPLGVIYAKARGLNYVYQYYTREYTVLERAFIDERTCVACHLGDDKRFPGAARMRKAPTDHEDILLRNQSCLSCHADTGHAVKLGVKAKFP